MYIYDGVVIHFTKFNKDKEVEALFRKKVHSEALLVNSPTCREFFTEKASLKVINYTHFDIGLSSRNYLRIQDDLFDLISTRENKIFAFNIYYYPDVIFIVQKNKMNLYFVFRDGVWNPLQNGKECLNNASIKRKAFTIWKGVKDNDFILNSLPKEIIELVIKKFLLVHDIKEIQVGLKTSTTGICIRYWSMVSSNYRNSI